MKIMNTLTNSAVSPVIEINPAVQCKGSENSSGVVTLCLAVLGVIGAGTMWCWAIVNLGGLLMQAETLLLRNNIQLY